jgi:hypothetical protein
VVAAVSVGPAGAVKRRPRPGDLRHQFGCAQLPARVHPIIQLISSRSSNVVPALALAGRVTSGVPRPAPRIAEARVMDANRGPGHFIVAGASC